MVKIIALAASNSKNSINKKLIQYTAGLIQGSDIEIIDINDYQTTIFSIDEEIENGIPDSIKNFVNKLDEADVLIISFAEHNGSYATAFKNLFDWGSRVKLKLFECKVILMSATPGPFGGQTVLATAESRFPKHGAEIIGKYSFPSFKENFDEEKGIINDAKLEELKHILTKVNI
jgi:chromate reductase, NAD(P)H dehydrogenase (quinone)